MGSVAWTLAVTVAALAAGGGPPPPPLALNVRDFGARGDGVADDAPALAAADAAAGDAFATVVLPPGTYLLGAEWRLRSNRRYVGPGAVLRRRPGAGHRLWSGQDVSNVALEGLTFLGEELGRPIAATLPPGTQCVRCSDVLVRDCTFAGFARYGLQVSSGRRFRVASSRFDGGGGAPGISSAMLLFDTWPGTVTEDVAVVESTFTREGPSFWTAVQVRGTGANTATARRVQFANNVIRLPFEVDAIESTGIEFGPGTAEFTATGNLLTGGSMAFSIGGARAGALSGNTVVLGGSRTRARDRWDHKAFEVTHSADISITGNVIDGRDALGCGLRISRKNERVTVSGNVLRALGPGGCGIEFSFSSDGAITGNVIQAPTGADGRALFASRAEGLVLQGNRIRAGGPPPEALVRIEDSGGVHVDGNQLEGAFRRALHVVDSRAVSVASNHAVATEPGATGVEVTSRAPGARAAILANAIVAAGGARGIVAGGLEAASISGNAVELTPGDGQGVLVVARGGAPLSGLTVAGNGVSGGAGSPVLVTTDRGMPVLAPGAEFEVEYAGTAPPSGGLALPGARVRNAAPREVGRAGSRYVVTGWRCTAAGTPGTWVEERAATGR